MFEARFIRNSLVSMTFGRKQSINTRDIIRKKQNTNLVPLVSTPKLNRLLFWRELYWLANSKIEPSTKTVTIAFDTAF